MKEVRVTNKYEMFKKLEGNRATSQTRVEKIKKSIEKVGYITSPILVNQNMEIIDGQGRFEALKQMQLPVEYIVQEGIGFKECVAMNVHQTNWTAIDYINSYADKGVQSYIYIRDLMEKYKIKNVSIISVATISTSKFWEANLREGNIVITEEQYKKAIEKLDYVKEIREKGNIKRLALFIKGIMFCLDIEGIDKKRLKEKCLEALEYRKLPPIPTIEEVMMFIEEIYNKNSKRPTLYIYTEYRKQVEERLARQARKLNEIYRMYKSAPELSDLNKPE